jgi:hypothetical protein
MTQASIRTADSMRLQTRCWAFPGVGGAGIDRWVRVSRAAQPNGPGADVVRGLSKRIDLRLVSRLEFGSGAVAMRYEPRDVDREGISRFTNCRESKLWS